MKEELDRALEVLKSGGIIVYPTDTIWGIGCDATNANAVERVFELKGREKNKSMIVLLDSENKLQSYVSQVPDIAYDLIDYAEKPLTIIYSGAKNLPKNVIAEDGTLAIRICKHPFCQKLIEKLKKPLLSTSANLSGQRSPSSFEEIDEEIIRGADYVVDIDQSVKSLNPPSTIMKLEADGRFAFIRK